MKYCLCGKELLPGLFYACRPTRCKKCHSMEANRGIRSGQRVRRKVWVEKPGRAVKVSWVSYLKKRCNNIKDKCKKNNIPYEMEWKLLVSLKERQGGKCFYTDTPLSFGGGSWTSKCSIDRIVPSLGYVEGNVVLCCSRINTIKSDISLDEMELWMPGWRNRIREFNGW